MNDETQTKFFVNISKKVLTFTSLVNRYIFVTVYLEEYRFVQFFQSKCYKLLHVFYHQFEQN